MDQICPIRTHKRNEINNKIVTDPMTMSNEFNKFFTNIETNLANKISNVDGIYQIT